MGFYYNLITPFASGSQPMLIYVLNKYKVPLSEATGIITNKTLLYGGSKPLKSQHAGYTDDEIYIPLIVINTNNI